MHGGRRSPRRHDHARAEPEVGGRHISCPRGGGRRCGVQGASHGGATVEEAASPSGTVEEATASTGAALVAAPLAVAKVVKLIELDAARMSFHVPALAASAAPLTAALETCE